MEKKQKICIVVKAFLEHPTYSMLELAELPELESINVSGEEVLSYLNDNLIIQLFDIWTYNDIKNKLNQNLQMVKNVKKEVSEKSSSKLKGNIKASSIKTLTPKEKRKMDHIYTFTKIHLKYPKISCDRIAMLYNQNNVIGEVVTADYVSECLMSKGCSNFFADNIWSYNPVYLLNSQQENKDKMIK